MSIINLDSLIYSRLMVQLTFDPWAACNSGIDGKVPENIMEVLQGRSCHVRTEMYAFLDRCLRAYW